MIKTMKSNQINAKVNPLLINAHKLNEENKKICASKKKDFIQEFSDISKHASLSSSKENIMNKKRR